jgi:hypothetical protein
MPRRIAPKKQAQKSVIYLTFFILFSIPIVLYGLAQENLDTRNRAFQDLELSEEHPCLISLPNVNPYSLAVGRTVTIQVDARLKDEIISELEIYNSSEEIIYTEKFENSPIEIATSFLFTPLNSGMVDLQGRIKREQGGVVECEISSPYDIMGLRAVANNGSPEFKSHPAESKPSQDIKTGDQYEYTLVASDVDGDRINYSFSFTPRADWLKPIIIEDGSSGKLTIRFRGTTNKPASYLANVFIHDGYSQHLRSQSWVISVSPKENDIPIIRIIDPSESVRIDQGESFKTTWEAADLNHIVRYELYMTNNPANENEWKLIDKNIQYNASFYNIDTSKLEPGTYKAILKGIDNQNPPATGMGVSPEIVVSKSDQKKPQSDDVVTLKQPQIVNMSPTSTEDISNKRVTIRATIIASEEANIEDKSIALKLDETDISNSVKINKISTNEYTLIYQPEEDLKEGVHKAEVSFSDNKNLDISKSWNFTIKSGTESKEETYNILGYEVSRNIVLIVGIGAITIILALLAPFVIFTIWKDDKKVDEYTPYKNEKLPPSTPEDDTKYIQPKESSQSVVREKIESEPKVKNEDVWDMYSAPKPVVSKEQEKEDLEAVQELPQKQTAPPEEQIEVKSVAVETSVEEIEPPTQPDTIVPEEPLIPEPEIPDIEDLEKIFQQIQETQESETPQEEPPVVKE